MGWGALVGPEYAALFQFEIMSSYINSFNYMNSELNPVIEGGWFVIFSLPSPKFTALTVY